MKVFIVCSKQTESMKTTLHSAYSDIEKAREEIEELRDDDDDKYYYIKDMEVEENEREKIEG